MWNGKCRSKFLTGKVTSWEFLGARVLVSQARQLRETSIYELLKKRETSIKCFPITVFTVLASTNPYI